MDFGVSTAVLICILCLGVANLLNQFQICRMRKSIDAMKTVLDLVLKELKVINPNVQQDLERFVRQALDK